MTLKLKPLEKIKIWNLKNYAESNVRLFEDISKQKEDINLFCRVRGLNIYFVLYTQKDSYLVRHINISRKSSYPTPEQVNFVLKQFGFKGLIQDDAIEGLIISVDEQRFALSISELI